MGILDMLGMGGPAAGGGLGIGEQLQAGFAPDVYAAKHQRAMEQALQAAMAQRSGVTPEQAHAFGMSPQYMQQFGQAYMPQVPQVHWSPNQEGGESPFMSNVSGQNASVSQMGINPVGTTPSPMQAIGAGPQSPPPGGGIQQPQAAPQSLTAPPPGKVQTSTSGFSNIADNAKAMREAGKSEAEIISLLPSSIRPYMADVLDGKADLDTLAQRDPRAPSKNLLKELAHAIRPGWDERQAKAQQLYINNYMDPKNMQLGGLRTTIGAASGHLADTGDLFTGLQNYGQGNQGPSSYLPEGAIPDREGKGGAKGAQTINEIKNRWNSSLVSDLGTLAPIAAKEIDRLISRGTPTVTGTEEYQRQLNAPNASPAAQAGALRGIKNAFHDQVLGMEAERDDAFRNNPERTKDYPIRNDLYEANMKRIEDQIVKLDPTGPEAQDRKQGAEIRVDKQGNKWTRDASGKVVPYGGK